MIRIGFIGAVSKEWMGALNYYKNLLYAISTLENKEIEIFVFVGKKTDNEIKNMFKQYAIVIEHSMFDRKSIKWFLHKIENKFFKTNFILNFILKKYNIDVLSHSSIINIGSIKTINWIPDFQHLHLPDMFSQKEIKSRDKEYMKLIVNSDKIILSSFDAFKDFKKFASKYIDKASVLQFVSQPNKSYLNLTDEDKNNLFIKYNIEKEFFYMPNQFWKHKNHMLVFEAVKLIAMENKDISLVCTGYLNDYRNEEYTDEIRNFIKKHKLEDNIKLLGLVDYEDVFRLIRFSKVVINPSLFEGWSSTVEECKSVGKNMILSDLGVHKEQYLEAIFFERDNVISLKERLLNYTFESDILSRTDLNKRTKDFALKYIETVLEVVNDG